MVKSVVVVLMLIVLQGCAALEPRVHVQEVKIPVYSCPEPEPIGRPYLFFRTLSDLDKQDPGKVAQAYYITIEQLLEYSNMLEEQLKFYSVTSKTLRGLAVPRDIDSVLEPPKLRDVIQPPKTKQSP